MKYTLTLKQSFPFAANVRFVELEDEKILTNEVVFPWDQNKTKLWVLGNEYGAMCAVWSDCESDAWDLAMDNDLVDGIRIEEDGCDENTRRIGNYGEPVDMEHAWMAIVEFDKVRDFDLIVKLAEARGAAADSLDEV